MRRPRPIAAFDTLGCLLLVFVVIALIERPQASPVSPQTSGQYAVIISWPRANQDDIDEYVMDPAGNTAWFGGLNAGNMHLEHDDLGAAGNYPGQPNVERVIIRQAIPGEYIVNIHMYFKYSKGQVRIQADLWRLTGTPTVLLSRTASLSFNGQEHTMFRFTVRDGRLVSSNDLPRTMVRSDRAAPVGGHIG